ncbi:hypothetical protein EV426DRAFT_579086 [Tirmania nivea]|nr:hypothetical protein EV426DRAFT_579086 [Tirmania nivea]
MDKEEDMEGMDDEEEDIEGMDDEEEDMEGIDNEEEVEEERELEEEDIEICVRRILVVKPELREPIIVKLVLEACLLVLDLEEYRVANSTFNVVELRAMNSRIVKLELQAEAVNTQAEAMSTEAIIECVNSQAGARNIEARAMSIFLAMELTEYGIASSTSNKLGMCGQSSWSWKYVGSGARAVVKPELEVHKVVEPELVVEPGLEICKIVKSIIGACLLVVESIKHSVVVEPMLGLEVPLISAESVSNISWERVGSQTIAAVKPELGVHRVVELELGVRRIVESELGVYRVVEPKLGACRVTKPELYTRNTRYAGYAGCVVCRYTGCGLLGMLGIPSSMLEMQAAWYTGLHSMLGILGMLAAGYTGYTGYTGWWDWVYWWEAREL